MTSSFFNIAGGLERELDRSWFNEQSAARNLANLHTPGYRGYRLAPDPTDDFADLLGQELERTNENHLSLLPEDAGSDFQKVSVEDLSPDTEMAELSKNQMFYQTLLEVVNRRDRLTRTALEGR